ncbi:hypothetical protein LXL04_007304 [Taraxacum kok-saghyz]
MQELSFNWILNRSKLNVFDLSLWISNPFLFRGFDFHSFAVFYWNSIPPPPEPTLTTPSPATPASMLHLRPHKKAIQLNCLRLDLVNEFID